MFEYEPNSQAQPLPHIREDVKNRLLEDLGLDVPAGTQQVIEGITKSPFRSLNEQLHDFTTSTFSDVLDSYFLTCMPKILTLDPFKRKLISMNLRI